MNNPTDTNQASELFELCKGVYERLPEWDDSSLSFYHNIVASTAPPKYEVEQKREYYHVEAPLYTSDYLLGKLPNWIEMLKKPEGYAFRKMVQAQPINHYTQEESDTPLKALLKLVIALSEAGELNNDQS